MLGIHNHIPYHILG